MVVEHVFTLDRQRFRIFIGNKETLRRIVEIRGRRRRVPVARKTLVQHLCRDLSKARELVWNCFAWTKEAMVLVVDASPHVPVKWNAENDFIGRNSSLFISLNRTVR